MDKEERKHSMTAYERPFPYSHNSCSGQDEGWSVEARYIFPEAKEFGKQIFDSRWRQVDFFQSPIGVPSTTMLHRHASSMGLLPYQSAQALRWWFLAELERECMGSLCMETRLVRHTVKYSLSCEAVSAHDNLGGDLAQFCPNRPIDMQGEGRGVKKFNDSMVD